MDFDLEIYLKETFSTHDKDGSGFLDEGEFSSVLKDLGFHYSSGFICSILQACFTEDEWERKQNSLEFQDFVEFFELFQPVDEEIRSSLAQKLSEAAGDTVDQNDFESLAPYMILVEFDQATQSYVWDEADNALLKDLGLLDDEQQETKLCPSTISGKLSTEIATEISKTKLSSEKNSELVTDDLESLDEGYDLEELSVFSESLVLKSKPEELLSTKLQTFSQDQEKIFENASAQIEKEILNEKEQKMKPYLTPDVEQDVGELETIWHEILSFFDFDNDGRLGTAEISRALLASGMEVNDTELQELCKEIDVDNDGTLDFQEFKVFYGKFSQKFYEKGLDFDVMSKLFDEYDFDCSGGLQKEEFYQIMFLLCPKVKLNQVVELLQMFDSSKDGQISFEEFEFFLRSNTESSKQVLRQILRAQNPSPLETLVAFANMPSHFRSSYLVDEILRKPTNHGHVASKLISPKLESNGLLYKNIRVGIQNHELVPVQITYKLFLFELIKCVGVPSPTDDIRKRIVGRRMRLCIFQNNKPVSNVWSLPVFWSEEEEDVWCVGRKAINFNMNADPSASEWNKILVKLPENENYELVIECNVLVDADFADGKINRNSCSDAEVRVSDLAGNPPLEHTRDGCTYFVKEGKHKGYIVKEIDGIALQGKQTKKMMHEIKTESTLQLQKPNVSKVEMCCGWTSIPLNNHTNQGLIQLKLYGGKIGKRIPIKQSDILSKRKGVFGFMRKTGITQAPTSSILSIKFHSNTKLGAQVKYLDQRLLTSWRSTDVLRSYYECLADHCLRSVTPYRASSGYSLSLSTFSKIIDNPNIFSLLIDVWKVALKQQQLKKNSKKCEPKQEFVELVSKKFLPLIQTIQFAHRTHYLEILSSRSLKIYQSMLETGDVACLLKGDSIPFDISQMTFPINCS